MTLRTAQLEIQAEEYQQRCETLLAHVQEQQAEGVVLFDRDYILYYTGFAFIPTERPIAFFMDAAGERGIFVPALEIEHARTKAMVDRVAHYDEYPGRTHPMQILVETLRDNNIQKAIMADHDGYPWIFGYRGKALSQFEYMVQSPRGFIEDTMAIKSEAEINLLRESCRWANMAHTLLQRYTAVGVTETVVQQRASDEATRAMLDTIGPIYSAKSEYGVLAHAGYRGQIGRNAAIPHALANNLTFQPGDVLVTGATASIQGYTGELERTMFMGPASDEQKYFFDHMVALQDLAMSMLEPGRTCASVDEAVRQYYVEHDLMAYWKHHTGHTIGLRYHEGPFLDTGDETLIQSGMVFTVEPGLYTSSGGYRHSDTVVVTDDGSEMLTYYPRDIQSLTIPI